MNARMEYCLTTGRVCLSCVLVFVKSMHIYMFTSLHLVEPFLPSGVEVWQRACHIFLTCARDRACLQSTPFSSNVFWMLSCHLVRGLPLVLLPSYRSSHAMRGYLYLQVTVSKSILFYAQCVHGLCQSRQCSANYAYLHLAYVITAA
jgi:hypothetical protein